jgi:hypothetical protein
MSRELYRDGNYAITSFWGGDEKGRCFQIQQDYDRETHKESEQDHYYGYIHLTEKEAIELCLILLDAIEEKMSKTEKELKSKMKVLSEIAKEFNHSKISFGLLKTWYGIDEKFQNKKE